MTPPHTFAYPPPDQHLTLEETELLDELDEYGPNDTSNAPRKILCETIERIIDNMQRWDPVRLLLERHVDVNRKCRNSQSPLHMAIFQRLDVCEVLLRAGANMYIQDYDGDDVMANALRFYHVYPLHHSDFVNILIKHGFDVLLSHCTTHLRHALNLPINEFKELFETSHMGHQLWSITNGKRASKHRTINDYPIPRSKHRLFLRQHEFMTQLVVLCVPRTCNKSAVRKMPLDMFRLIGAMLV